MLRPATQNGSLRGGSGVITMGKRDRSRSAGVDPKIPKIVAQIRESLGDAAITADCLENQLSSEDFNKLGSAFRSAINGEQKEAYKHLGSDQERREVLAKFVLDPLKYKCVGENKTEIHNQRADKASGQWLIVDEIGGPLHLNNVKFAEALCKSGDIPSQPHELPSLAKLGVMQYWYEERKHEKSTGTTETAAVTKTADINPDEYAMVQTSMARNVASASPKTKPHLTTPKKS